MSDSNSPWWRQYRLQKYKPPVKLNIEMILRKSIDDTFTEYLKHVSLHSVKWVTEAPLFILARLLRVSIFLTMIVWSLFNLYYAVVDFMKNPLIVSTENDAYPISELDFPAVAICNINRISKKAALKYAEVVIPKLKEPYKNLNKPELMVWFIEELGRLIDFRLEVTNSNPIFLQVGEMFDVEPYEVADVMAQLSPKCEELLVACFWASRPIDCKEIFSVRRTILGHCCVFNYELDTNLAFQKPNVSLSNIKHQAVPGELSGLTLVVDIQSDDYNYPLTAMEGVEVLLFDPTHFPEYNGGGGVIQGYVQAEEFVSFSLQSVKQYATHEVRKQRLQNRKCLFKDERPDEYGNMYSYSTCLMKCRLKAIQSLCKCNPYFYPVSVADGPMCILHDVACLNRYREKFMYLYPIDAQTTEGLETEIQDSLYCPDCYPDCEFTKHRVMMSKLALNINEDIDHLFDDGLINKTGGSNMHDKAIISIHQGSPDAVLDRLDVVNYWFEIISSVGGEISILIGITNFNYVEVIYFFTVRLCRITVHNYKKYH